MRINFKTSSVPTRAAKRLKSILSIKESTAREWTAQVFGYRNWHELGQSLGREHPSPLDEDCTFEEVRERHRYQVERLRTCMANLGEAAPGRSAQSVIEAWAPSAKLPHSPFNGLFDAPIARIVGGAITGGEPILCLNSLSKSLLEGLPQQGTPWLKHEACSVARKLMRAGDEAEKTFARGILEELHLQGISAGTLQLAASLVQGQGGPVDRSRADTLFELLLDRPHTPYPVRILASEGRATLAGVGAGWPDNLDKALLTWKARVDEGDSGAAYLLALAYDPYKPLTRSAPADAGKAAQYYRIAAAAQHLDAAVSLGILLTSKPELATSVGEGLDWLQGAARRGDPLARELFDTLEVAQARVEALPEKASEALLHKLLEQYVPQSDRGDPVVAPGLGEMVFIPPTCWIQLSTGALFSREGETYTSLADGALSPDIISSYPRGEHKQLERAAWVMSTGETLNRFLPYIRRDSQRVSLRDSQRVSP